MANSNSRGIMRRVHVLYDEGVDNSSLSVTGYIIYSTLRSFCILIHLIGEAVMYHQAKHELVLLHPHPSPSKGQKQRLLATSTA